MPLIIPTITLKTNVKIPKGPGTMVKIFFLLQGHSCQFLYFNKRKTYLPLISRVMIFFLISGVNILFFCAKNDGKNNYTLKLIFNDQ